MADKINNYFQQEENRLVNKKDCIITIDLTNYTTPNSIKIEESEVWVKSLVCKVEFENKVFDIVLDYSITLTVYEFLEKTKDVLKLKYEANSTVLQATIEAAEIKGQIRYVERLLGGKEILKDVPHLYKKLLSVYSPPVTDMDSVHLEILISQVLRNKKDIQKVARLVEPYNPMLVNIKRVVFSSGFMQGLAFENVGEAIRTGLVSEDTEDRSIIERIMTGEVLPEETKKRVLKRSR